MIFLTLLAVPIVITLIGFIVSAIISKNSDDNVDTRRRYYFSPEQITLKEFLIQMGVIVVVVLIATVIIRHQNLMATEVWNGHVTKKWHQRVHCRHDYECFCYTTCDSKGNCTKHCQTCYEHDYDVDWLVRDNTGKTWDIDSPDRQGLVMPRFWDAVIIGEPTSHLHSYKNYIKAAADSLFHREGLVEKYSKLLPKYPDTIYHRWRLDRIIRMGGVKVDNIKELNYRLSEINGELGSKKQCNAIVVLIKNQPREYLYALEQYWVGGNKNDIVLVISVDDENKIQWADVLAFVQKSIFKIELRDEIQKMPILEMDKVLTTLEDQIKKNYKRKRMRDFEYLTASITPSTTQYVVTIIICTILSVGLSIIFHREDVA